MKEFRTHLFWENVEFLRKNAGLKQSELSEKVGKATSYIHNANKNSVVPMLDVALKLEDIFHVKVEELAYTPIGLEMRRVELLGELERINNAIELVNNHAI